MVFLLAFTMALNGPSTPEAVAQEFLATYLRQGDSGGHLAGARILYPHLSKRLVPVLEDASACQADWLRQQPKNSTNKPPFVDCCLFASSPEGVPTAFELGPVEVLEPGRYKVFIDFTYAEGPDTYADESIPLESWDWRDALIVTEENGRHAVDDFMFLRDSPESPPLLLSRSFSGCRGAYWIGRP
jgi:hypothetical protein